MKCILARLFHKPPIGLPYNKRGHSFHEEPEEEIIKSLDGDMMTFKNCMNALSYKTTQSSFDIMKAQFTNRDYYKRKCALEHIISHVRFNSNKEVLKEVVLDGNEMVVKSALEKIIRFGVKGAGEEVVFALEYWADNEEIQQLCQVILKKYKVEYKDLLKNSRREGEKLRVNNKIFEGNSQSVIEERMTDENYNKVYSEIISRYKPYVGVHTLERIADEFSKEGCGYAALATTLTQYFCDKDWQFKHKFGFDIKDGDGYATDKIMLDFYCMLDESGYGMNIEQLIERYEKYCNHYGIDIVINVVSSMDRNSFEEYTTDGYILLFAGNFTMYFMKYKPVKIDGWHIMNAYNMIDEDTMEISTWGQKYTIKISELNWDTKYVYIAYR